MAAVAAIGTWTSTVRVTPSATRVSVWSPGMSFTQSVAVSTVGAGAADTAGSTELGVGGEPTIGAAAAVALPSATATSTAIARASGRDFRVSGASAYESFGTMASP